MTRATPARTGHRFRPPQLKPALRARMRGGRLKTEDGADITPCTLFDAESGETGALIEVKVTLPPRILVLDEQDQTVCAASVLWHHGRQAALTLTGEPMLASRHLATQAF
ncbi:hypothetical protein [Pannonibacter phragmitetus]|nr:hypothetical protein [Pannonibacter phragmitetus]